jgi:hypothetical protein
VGTDHVFLHQLGEDDQVSVLRKLAICTALRVLIMLPFAPSVYAVSINALDCFAHPGLWICNKLPMLALFAPFLAVFGPIGEDAEDPPSPWPEIFLSALVMALVWWAGSWLVRRFVPMNRSPLSIPEQE